MNYSLLRKLCHLVILSAALAGGNCVAQESKGKELSWTAHDGTFVWNNFPFTRLYPDFTETEKATLHGFYEAIAPGDEPPYPSVNMETILRRMAQVREGHPVAGRVELLLLIGADGKVRSFSNLKSSSKEVADFNMQLLRDVRFKPAKCSGKPCEMNFPWSLTIL